METVAYLGRAVVHTTTVRPPPGLTVNLKKNCSVFVSFVSRLNRKIRVPLLLVTVRVFCLLKTTSKCNQTYQLGDKNDFFSGKVAQPLPHPTRRRKSWIRHCMETLQYNVTNTHGKNSNTRQND